MIGYQNSENLKRYNALHANKACVCHDKSDNSDFVAIFIRRPMEICQK